MVSKKTHDPLRDRRKPSEELERALAELREANERLVLAGIQLHELADEAERARANAERLRTQAEAANQAKDEFLAAVSHELRTPLNAILGWTHMLRTGTLTPAAIDRALETIERNATQQMQVVSDILRVSEIITGKLHLDVQAVDLASLVASSLEAVRPAAMVKDIALEAEMQSVGSILGDPDRVQQVLWNLLSNAIKFTPHGGRVHISLRQAGSVAELRVRDSGVGIAAEFLPHVFDRFRQEQSSYARSFGGLGLGLAIVRQLVELHGGTVKAESAGKDRGSTFTVSFPTRLGGLDAEPGDQRGPERSLDGLRVLVVDDEADSRDLLTALLEQRGAQVTEASSSKEALALLKVGRPDVIVADIGLPEQDGYAFMREVRAREDGRLSNVPALALTAYAGPMDRERALLSGYQMHMGKPFEPNHLIAAVERLTQRQVSR